MSGYIGHLQTQSDHVAFVHSVCLADARYSLPSNYQNRIRPVQPPDDKQEGYIVSGALAAFTENVVGRTKQDVLDATLFAQLACDQKYDREGEIVEWYGYYNHILGNLGFAIEDFNFLDHETSGISFQMNEAVIEVFEAIATGEEAEALKATLNAMRSLADDNQKITLFDYHARKTNLGNFQMYSCKQAPGGEVSLTIGAFHFEGSVRNGNFLFFSLDSSSSQLKMGAQRAVFNTEVYERVRPTISAKLGDNAVNLVASINLWM